jgi:hypothetical protein
VNIFDAIELAIDNFKAGTGSPPAKMKLGRTQVAALRDFIDSYSSHADRNMCDTASPKYRDIPIDETAEEDQLELE